MANPNWTAGVSGNPGGRPKVVAEVRELARKHTKKAVEVLVAILAHLIHHEPRDFPKSKHYQCLTGPVGSHT